MRTGRRVTSSVVSEMLRQRSNLTITPSPARGETPIEHQNPIVHLDEDFYASFVDLVLAEACVADDEQNRAQLIVYLVEGGVEAVAQTHLVPDDFAAFHLDVGGISVDPAVWTAALFRIAPEAESLLLDRLQEIRSQAAEVGRELGLLRFFRSTCCDAIATIDASTGEQRCAACGSVT